MTAAHAQHLYEQYEHAVEDGDLEHAHEMYERLVANDES